MLSPSFSSFFPLKTAEYAHLFSGCCFFYKLKDKVLYFAIRNLFPIFLSFIAIGSPAPFVLHQASIAKQQRTAIFPPAVRRSLFLSLHPKFASFFVHNAVFHRSSRPKNPFLSFVFIRAPLSKGRKKGRPVLRPAALASGVRFLENYISLMAACAAARRAIGTRKGEQET